MNGMKKNVEPLRRSVLRRADMVLAKIDQIRKLHNARLKRGASRCECCKCRNADPAAPWEL